MARQIRKKSGTGIYHIMLRGIPLMIQSLEKVRRNEILITAKAMGAGLRQQSRLKGVSFGVYKSCNDENNQKNRPHDPEGEGQVGKRDSQNIHGAASPSEYG